MKEKSVKEAPRKRIEDAVDLNEMPLNTIEDYKAFNREARKLGIRVKIPPSELHKQIKIRFQRFDQPENVLKTYVRNADIEWKGELIPGQTYTLPLPVVQFLNKLATPIYEQVKCEDGSGKRTETKQVGEKPRFSCQILEYAA